MRIVIDIDGTISELKKNGQTYTEVRMNDGAAEKIRELKNDGNYIILYSARHMKTCNGNVTLVEEKVGQITKDWLKKNEIPYDEIYFGKPYGEIYIDDLSYSFKGWDKINTEDFDEKKVNIIIPMAGKGSRFVNAGYKNPKPLIKVFGEPMIQWVMKTFDFLKKIKKYQLIFIISEEHDKEFDLGNKLKELFGPDIKIIFQTTSPHGQAHTCLFAKELINNNNKLFIYNCDTYSHAPVWEKIQESDPDGIVTCFEASDSKYSYVKLDKYGYINEAAEKKVISNLATTGLYYFKRGSDFVASAESMIKNNQTFNGEFYVAPCYNELIKAGKKLVPVMVTENWVLGTPEELDYFIKNYKK